MKEKVKEKLELLLKDLKINKQKEKENGKSYFNTDLMAIRIIEILKIINTNEKV